METQNCFYRVSIKALVLNETRDKFLIVKEDNGKWELPGGGLDWGTTPQEDLPREIAEEMGLKVIKVAEHPSYFISFMSRSKKFWMTNILYETELENLDFTPSEECTEVKFVDLEDLKDLPVFLNVLQFAEQFDLKRHLR